MSPALTLAGLLKISRKNMYMQIKLQIIWNFMMEFQEMDDPFLLFSFCITASPQNAMSLDKDRSVWFSREESRTLVLMKS